MSKGFDCVLSICEIFINTRLKYFGIYILNISKTGNDRSLFHFVYYKKTFDLYILFIKVHEGTDKHF